MVDLQHDEPGRSEDMSVEIWNEAYDVETGMANLPSFLDHVGHAMRRLRRSPLTMAVLTASGDELVAPLAGRSRAERALLVAAGRRIQRSIRPGDVIARVGDATFAVLCEDLTSYDHAVGVAVRLLEELDRPFLVDDEEVGVHLRFGVAFPLADEEAARPVLERSLEALRAARVDPSARYDVILGSPADMAEPLDESARARPTSPAVADDPADGSRPTSSSRSDRQGDPDEPPAD